MSNTNLAIGIVGLPNVGKSTLFNALLKKQVALAANYPFATIEPNIGVVAVPDDRLTVLATLVQATSKNPNVPEKITPATIKFYDIAGLVKGAAQGLGLGNQFLSHIREVDAIAHVIRDFSDEGIVREGAINPQADKETIETELILADLQLLSKRLDRSSDTTKKQTPETEVTSVYQKLYTALNSGISGRDVSLSQEELALIKDLNLLTLKPCIYVYNCDETAVLSEHASTSLTKVAICAKLEADLALLDPSDQKAYLAELNLSESGLDRFIKASYTILGLQTFLTAGEKEVRAWTITKGATAPQAAGRIHTDFELGFIKAKVVAFSDFVTAGGWLGAKTAGTLRLEGKEYVMQDGDVVEFMFNV